MSLYSFIWPSQFTFLMSSIILFLFTIIVHHPLIFDPTFLSSRRSICVHQLSLLCCWESANNLLVGLPSNPSKPHYQYYFCKAQLPFITPCYHLWTLYYFLAQVSADNVWKHTICPIIFFQPSLTVAKNYMLPKSKSWPSPMTCNIVCVCFCLCAFFSTCRQLSSSFPLQIMSLLLNPLRDPFVRSLMPTTPFPSLSLASPLRLSWVKNLSSTTYGLCDLWKSLMLQVIMQIKANGQTSKAASLGNTNGHRKTTRCVSLQLLILGQHTAIW